MDTQPPAQVQTRDRRTVWYVARDLIMRRLGIQHDVASACAILNEPPPELQQVALNFLATFF